MRCRRGARSRAAFARRPEARRRPRRRRSAPPSTDSRAVAADHLGLVRELVPREHEEAAAAEKLVLPAGHDLRAALTRLVGLVVVLFAFEAGGHRALAEHYVEGLLDVVGVQLLVEVHDVVVVLFLGG